VTFVAIGGQLFREEFFDRPCGEPPNHPSGVGVTRTVRRICFEFVSTEGVQVTHIFENTDWLPVREDGVPSSDFVSGSGRSFTCDFVVFYRFLYDILKVRWQFVHESELPRGDAIRDIILIVNPFVGKWTQYQIVIPA
jgi:hypothetical protein